MSACCRRLGWLDDARRQLEDARRLVDRPGAPAELRAAVSLEVGLMELDAADLEKARKALEEVIALLDGTEDTQGARFEARLALGRLHLARGESDEARRSLVSAGEELRGPELRQRARLLRAEAVLAVRTQDFPAARRSLLEARRHQEEVLGPQHPELALTEQTYAGVELLRGHMATAEASLRSSLATLRLTLGESHPVTLRAQSGLASVLGQWGYFEESLRLKTETLAGYQKRLPQDHPNLAILRQNIAATQTYRGELQAARENLLAAIESLSEKLGARHRNALSARADLAYLDLFQGEFQGAARGFEDVLRDYGERPCDLFPPTLQLFRAEALLLGSDAPAASRVLGQVDDSLSDLRRDCSDIQPRGLEGFASSVALLRGDLLAARGEADGARDAWLEAAGEDDGEAVLGQGVKRQHIVALALVRLGRVESAAPVLRRLHRIGWAHPSFQALADGEIPAG